MKSFSFLLSSLECELLFREISSPLHLEKIKSFKPSDELSNYIIFADEEFNIGIAWYCEDKASGAIYRIDPEYGNAPVFINSTMQKFEGSIIAANEWSANHNSKEIMRNPKVIDVLYNTIQNIDPKAFESKSSHWPVLIEHIKIDASDYDEEMVFRFEIT